MYNITYLYIYYLNKSRSFFFFFLFAFFLLFFLSLTQTNVNTHTDTQEIGISYLRRAPETRSAEPQSIKSRVIHTGGVACRLEYISRIRRTLLHNESVFSSLQINRILQLTNNKSQTTIMNTFVKVSVFILYCNKYIIQSL